MLSVCFVFSFKDTVPTPLCIYSSRTNHLACKNIYLVVHETCQLAPTQISCCVMGRVLLFRDVSTRAADKCLIDYLFLKSLLGSPLEV